MTADPEILVAPGTYFDGRSARPHPVTIRFGDRLEITGEGVREDWNRLDVRAASQTEAPMMRLGCAGRAVRVEFNDARLAAAIGARCPDLRKDEEGGGGVLRLVAWSIVAGVAVILVAVFGVPPAAGLIAPFVPPAVEARFGAAVDRQIVSLLSDPPLCTNPAGQAALDRLVDKLIEGIDLPARPVVTVRRHDVANALTLPGGRVIVLSDILDKSKTPDEFAGILGHEFGHIAARDPTRSVIAASGVSFLLSLILGDFTGSTIVVAVGQAAISAGYSRDAERAADAFGVDLMNRAGGDGTSLATILERIDSEEDDGSTVTDLLRSHPYTKERAATIRALVREGARREPILSDADWQSLRGICPSKAGKAAPEDRTSQQKDTKKDENAKAKPHSKHKP